MKFPRRKTTFSQLNLSIRILILLIFTCYFTNSNGQNMFVYSSLTNYVVQKENIIKHENLYYISFYQNNNGELIGLGLVPKGKNTSLITLHDLSFFDYEYDNDGGKIFLFSCYMEISGVRNQEPFVLHVAENYSYISIYFDQVNFQTFFLDKLIHSEKK